MTKRRRKVVTFSICMLSMIGMLSWWQMNSHPPTPEFLVKAGGEVRYLGSYRAEVEVDSGVSPEHPTYAETWVFSTTAPEQSVILALADQIGDANVAVGHLGAWSHDTNFSYWVFVSGRGKTRQVRAYMSREFSLGELDYGIGKTWGKWIDIRLRLGEEPDPISFEDKIRPRYGSKGKIIAFTNPPIDVAALKKLRPKLLVGDSGYPITNRWPLAP